MFMATLIVEMLAVLAGMLAMQVCIRIVHAQQCVHVPKTC